MKRTLGAVLSLALVFQTLFLEAAMETLRMEPMNSEFSLPSPVALSLPINASSLGGQGMNGLLDVSVPPLELEKDAVLSSPIQEIGTVPISQREQKEMGTVPISLSVLRAAGDRAVPKKSSPSNSDATTQASSWSRFWSGQKQDKEDPPVRGSALTKVPSKRSRAIPLLKGLGQKAAPLALISLIPAPAFAATAAAHWGVPAVLHPYLLASGFLALTYATHRAISWSIRKLSATLHWSPNTTDAVRFVGSASNWLLGLGLILHSAGVSGGTLFTTGGIALGLAINKNLANLMRAALFVINHPFNLGDKMRIGDKIYEVTALEPKYATLKFLGIVPGSAALPDQKPSYSYFTYSQLAEKAVELYRPFDNSETRISFKLLFQLKLRPLWQALKRLDKSAYVKAALWSAGLILLGAALPILKAHAAYHWIGILLPYFQSLFALLLSNAAARFFGKFLPIIGRYAKWNAQTTTLFRLALQLTAYLIGISLAIGALGINIGSLAVGLGVGTAAFTLASSNILGNIAQAVSLRWQSPFKIGDQIQISGEKGEVLEIGLFYIVLKTAEGRHTLIPYSLVDSNELTTHKSSKTLESEMERKL